MDTACIKLLCPYYEGCKRCVDDPILIEYATDLGNKVQDCNTYLSKNYIFLTDSVTCSNCLGGHEHKLTL